MLISSISSIQQAASQSSRLFEEQLAHIDEYMRVKKLPASLREKTKDYFYLKFSNGKVINEEEILDQLSPVLRRDIKHFVGRDILKKMPILSNPTHRDFAQEIACVIEPVIVFANEVILREGTTGDELFFILSGVVEIYVAAFKFTSYNAVGDGCVSAICFHSFKFPSIRLLHHFTSSQQYFGDVAVLLNVRRTASAKSTTQCTLYRLKKENLLSLLADYPAIETKMMNVAQSRRRRLAHYLNPKGVSLCAGDEIDVEDSKTELFGQDADIILHDKQKEDQLNRLQSGIKSKRTHA
jgi:CRP-like cAMP-binding protein